jgi:hypothetical protein
VPDVDNVTVAELLDAWERGGAASPGEQALLLLTVAHPQLPAESLAGWTIGRRDMALLALRERMFGPRLAAAAACLRCGEALETEFAPADIVVGQELEPPPTLSLEEGGYKVIYRLPTTGDMAALAREAAASEAERWLLSRCVLDARRPEAPCSVADLPDKVLEAVADGMAKADPQAEVELAFTCPACGHRWTALFDIVSFLWRELDAWAGRTLREVAALASAFGWSERDVLALTPWRRRHYLELAGA